MQGERIPIPKYRNEHNHMGPTPRAGFGGPRPPPPGGSTPPGKLGHSPQQRRGVVCRLLPES